MRGFATSSLNELYSKAALGEIPSHVAIIMDGNGRWASAHKLGRIRGHRRGIQAIREVVRAGTRLQVKFITLYAFSTENWSRPREEVEALWNLMKEFLEKEVPDLKKNNVRISHIGKVQGIPEHALKKLDWAEKETSQSSGLTLTLALNYGSRDEIIEAFNSILQSGDHLKGPVDAALISKHLYTREMPDPDLLIRTSGEQRISNFLLWQISYAELYFTKVLWPDFGEENFLEAILEYQSRHRRFGGI